MKTESKYVVLVSEVKDLYWKGRYNSETNEVNLEYDASVALGTPVYSIVRNYIQFRGQDVDHVITLLQNLKAESNL